MLRHIISYSVIGAAAVSTGLSLHANDYNVNNLGIVRLARSAVTVFNIGLTYKTQLYYKEWDTTTNEYKQQKGKIHKIAAEKLLDLICSNKGVYIKVGQHIGALEYLLPSEYVETMKVLHSNAPQNPVEDLYKVIRQDLKKDPSEIFESFESKPLGTASLAQVHKATLKTGEVVAVKVQHPYVKGNSIVDMKTMEVLVNIMAYVFPDFKIQWLVDESKKNLPVELDFVNEGRNAEKAAEMFKQYNWLKIPKIYWNLSTSRVLVMEFLEGAQVNDLDYIKRNKIDRFDIASKIGYIFSSMIFTHGFVHGDPHPGNILVHKNASGSIDIIMLDHGLYANLSEKFRYEYSKFWQSVLNVDEDSMQKHANNLGLKGRLYVIYACMVTGRTWSSITRGVDKTLFTQSEVAEIFKQYNWLKIPKIYWNLSTSRVLVMEFLEGAQVNDLDYIKRNKIDRFDIASKIGYIFSNMIFTHGFVHGDPHPGNILVHKNASGSIDIVLLDHGLYANLSEQFRYEYSKFWQSLLNVDEDSMKKHANNLGLKGRLYVIYACMVTGRTWSSITHGVDKTLFTQSEVAEMFKNYKWLKVPKIYWDLSTPRILVMEYLDGGHVTDLNYIRKNKIDRFEVANKIGRLYSDMIFINGFVHSDPHPGNILVCKNKFGNTDIVLLDHGLYANLSEKFRYEYSKLWLSILNVDQKAMRVHAENLGIKGKLYGLFACMLTGRPWESIISGVDRTRYSSNEKELVQNNSALVLPHIADILDQVDRQMLLVLKTNDLIRGIEATLQTQNRMTAFWVMSKCCIKSVYRVELKEVTKFQRIRKVLREHWEIFKLNLFYLYLGLVNFGLITSIKQML